MKTTTTQTTTSTLTATAQHLGWDVLSTLTDAVNYGIYEEADGSFPSAYKAGGMPALWLKNQFDFPILESLGLINSVGRIAPNTVYTFCTYGSAAICNLKKGVFYARSSGGHWICYKRGNMSSDIPTSTVSPVMVEENTPPRKRVLTKKPRVLKPSSGLIKQ